MTGQAIAHGTTRPRTGCSRRAPSQPRTAPPSARQPEGQCQQRVPGQDRVSGPEHRPRGRAVAAHLVAIHHIVMQHREVVHELDRDRRWNGCLRVSPGGLRGQQRQRGANRLAGVAAGRFPLAIAPAEVIAGDLARRRRQLGDGIAQPRIDGRPRRWRTALPRRIQALSSGRQLASFSQHALIVFGPFDAGHL